MAGARIGVAAGSAAMTANGGATRMAEAARFLFGCAEVLAVADSTVWCGLVGARIGPNVSATDTEAQTLEETEPATSTMPWCATVREEKWWRSLGGGWADERSTTHAGGGALSRDAVAAIRATQTATTNFRASTATSPVDSTTTSSPFSGAVRSWCCAEAEITAPRLGLVFLRQPRPSASTPPSPPRAGGGSELARTLLWALPRRHRRVPASAPAPMFCSLASSGRRWAWGAPLLFPLFPTFCCLVYPPSPPFLSGLGDSGGAGGDAAHDPSTPASSWTDAFMHSTPRTPLFATVRDWACAGRGTWCRFLLRVWHAEFARSFPFAHLFAGPIYMSSSTFRRLYYFTTPFCFAPGLPFFFGGPPALSGSTSHLVA